jgi:hypothetical protein
VVRASKLGAPENKKIHDEFVPFYGLSPSVSDPVAVFLNY